MVLAVSMEILPVARVALPAPPLAGLAVGVELFLHQIHCQTPIQERQEEVAMERSVLCYCRTFITSSNGKVRVWLSLWFLLILGMKTKDTRNA